MNYGASNAVLSGIDRGISIRQAAQQLALNKAKTEQTMAINESNRVITQEKHNADMEKLNLEIDKMKNEKMKNDIYGAWEAKSVIKLNNIIETNDKAKTLFGYQNIDFYPHKPTAIQTSLREQKGIKIENAYLGDKIMSDGTIKREVFDMNKLKIASGFSTYIKNKELNKQAQDAKTKETLAHAKSFTANANNVQADADIKNKRIELAIRALDEGKSPREVERILSGKAETAESIGQYQKQINTYKRNNPDATPEELKIYINQVMNKSIQGVKSNREQSDISSITNNQTTAIDIVDNYVPEKYNRKDAIRLEASIKQKLDTATKDSIKKDTATMKANHKMVTSIDRILKEATEGDIKVDKDAIANASTYVSTVFGNDTPEALKNVAFNTAGGLLLAGFMKDISGTAVGVAEADRLTKIFQGGNLADETFVKLAMAKFAKESREANKILKTNNKQYMPDTVIKLTTYGDEETKEVPKQYERTATKPSTGEKMGYINGNWELIK